MPAAIPDFKNLPDSALLRERQLVGHVLPFASPTLWRRVKCGEFPQPVRLPGRITAWKWGDVRQWLESHGKAAA